MRVSKPTSHMVDIMVDIGPLDHASRLPTVARTRNGMMTICRSCRQPVMEEYFIAGFKAGEPNMILHESCCSDEPAVKRLGPENTGKSLNEKFSKEVR